MHASYGKRRALLAALGGALALSACGTEHNGAAASDAGALVVVSASAAAPLPGATDGLSPAAQLARVHSA